MPTSIRLPPSPKVEIEFTAGVWTDVTADVDREASPLEMHYGRSSEFSAAQSATFTVALRNDTQNYTPQNQASPYWPNIQPRKRIRYSYNPGVQRFRFFGYVKQWQPIMVDGWRPVMLISAADRMDQLSRVLMRGPIAQETIIDDPNLWWSLTDSAGSTQAFEQSGNIQPPLLIAGSGNALTFGDNGPGFGDGTGVLFAAGQYLTTGLAGISFGLIGGSLSARQFTAEFWFNIAAAPGATQAMLTLDGEHGLGTLGPITISINNARNVVVTYELGTITSSTVASVAAWHHVVLTRNTSNGYVLYLDGSNVGSATGLSSFGSWQTVTVGQSAAGAASALFAGNIGQVAFYPTPLSTGRITTHFQAGRGYPGDTTSGRIARFLGYAGLTGSDWTLDTGQAAVGTYPQDGQSIAAGCQDMATTEGGGGAFYITPDGKVRFANRRYRDSRTVKLTVNVVNPDLDPNTYQPSYDDVTLVNQATANRSAASGTLTSQTYTNTSSVTQFGLSSTDVTTYTISDLDAVNLAQYVVAAQANPALRFPQIAVDLAKAEANLYDAVAQLLIGDRIELTLMPATAYPLSTLDFFIEGWTETDLVDSHPVVFDVTAADNPPRGKWDTSRWAPDPGSMTLNAGISNSATTLVVATAASKPTFTTAGGAYPLKIKIGEEHIQLNTAPGGSTSPQTFTGVTRAVDGTAPAPQLAGAAVTLAPTDCWAL